MPTWIGQAIITWVGDRGAAKVETPKVPRKACNLDSLKRCFLLRKSIQGGWGGGTIDFGGATVPKLMRRHRNLSAPSTNTLNSGVQCGTLQS